MTVTKKDRPELAKVIVQASTGDQEVIESCHDLAAVRRICLNSLDNSRREGDCGFVERIN